MLGTVDAAAALAELTDISPQIRRVVVVGEDGQVLTDPTTNRDKPLLGFDWPFLTALSSAPMMRGAPPVR